MFMLTMTTVKPKKIKKAMVDHAWIEVMQEYLHQFDRLNVWELVDKPLERQGLILSGFGKTRKMKTILQPDGFVDPDHIGKVYRLKKALYGLKQSPRACFDKLSTFLIYNGFTKGGIFISQSKYALEILRKLRMDKYDDNGTPMATKPKVDADLSGTLIDQTRYRSIIWSLMYLSSSRPDIKQVLCYCAHYQARLIQNSLKEVKRIFWSCLNEAKARKIELKLGITSKDEKGKDL
nr:hypothetical protein [Tanacetum cinerariifolium]